MSRPVRVGLVAEGWTDRSVVNAAILALLGTRTYELRMLQPEDPASTGPFANNRPGGWTGIYKWCREVVQRAGRLRDDVTLTTYDIVILHLDADVAACDYHGAHIEDAPNPNNLPCGHPVCPPCSNTTNALRIVLLEWVAESTTPPQVVLCTPSASTEAWVLVALYPNDGAVTGGNLECIPVPANLLQAKPAGERLISGGSKKVDRYVEREQDITVAWNSVRNICSEADRFSLDFLVATPP
jgi:hypothetical protein